MPKKQAGSGSGSGKSSKKKLRAGRNKMLRQQLHLAVHSPKASKAGRVKQANKPANKRAAEIKAGVFMDWWPRELPDDAISTMPEALESLSTKVWREYHHPVQPPVEIDGVFVPSEVVVQIARELEAAAA